MHQANQANPDVVRISERLANGELSHRILFDVISKANQYRLTDKQVWLICKIETEQDNPVRKAGPVSVGSLSGLLDLLRSAKQHLKFPKFRVRSDDGDVIVSMAGDRSANPGWLYVKSPGGWGESTYYGKAEPKSGEFKPSRDATPAIVEALKKFSADPAGVASEYGKLTGNCCFCTKPLSDERSTSVGYGGTCAKHYGLPWGK